MPEPDAGRGRQRVEGRFADVVAMKRKHGIATVAATALVGLSAGAARAATRLEQAELAGLTPHLRAQVLARATHGNSVTEVLPVMLLNYIKIKHQASHIVAMDWNRGVAVVQLPNGGLEAVPFDPRTLQITS
jgi:hypothetical protein